MMMRPRVEDRRPFLVLLGGLIVLAWLALWLWSQSPYARFLDHGEIGGASEVSYLQLLALFAIGWTVMTTAMMLPTSLPLIALFRIVISQRADRRRLMLLLIAGYLAVWGAFGVAAHAGDLLVHVAVERIGWLEERGWLIGAATLLLAGAYQLSPLKHLCLDKCRSPMSFVIEHWRGVHPARDALRLGLHHGVFCVGCCWSLMLLMFVTGVGSIGWMLGLGAVMAVEKNLPIGRRVTRPLGIALLVAGMAIVVLNVDLATACAHGAGSC